MLRRGLYAAADAKMVVAGHSLRAVPHRCAAAIPL